MLLTKHKTDSPTRLLRDQSHLVSRIVENPDPLRMLDEVLDKLMEQPGLDAVWVVFTENHPEETHPLVCRGLSESLVTSLEDGACLWRQLARAENPVPDWEACWREHAGAFAAEGLCEPAFHPICSDGLMVGALVAATRRDTPLEDPLQVLLESVATCLGERVRRLRTEAELRNSRHNLDNLLETIDDIIFIVDGAGRIVFTNAGEMVHLGLDGATLPGSLLEDILPGSHCHLAGVDRIADTAQGLHCFLDKRMDLVGGKGNSTPLEVRAYQGRWDDHNVSYLVCRDITNQVGMEREHDRLVKAISQTRDSVIITDAAGRITYTNPAFSRLTGYSTAEILGATTDFLKSGEHDKYFYRELWETLRAGRDWSGRMINRRKNGELFVELATISPVRDDRGAITHFVAVKRDITHEVVLEERLQQSQKLETIGTLTGGLAHDFNNILYALMGFTQLALDDLAGDDPAIGSLHEVMKAAERARKLVERMLTLGRQKRGAVERVTLPDLVSLNLELTKTGLPGNVTVATEMDSNTGPVMADPVRLQQVICNLCTNSAEALQPDGGTLTIRVADYSHDGGIACTGKDLPAGDWVRLEVSDTGRGIGPAVLDRIFEPYFTTHNTQDGAGLGLASVQGIIVSLGGHIHATSEPGRGSTFTCFLPQAERPESSPRLETGKNAGGGAPGRILVVDDEQMIVDVVVKSLARNGFHVSGCIDAAEALEMVRTDPAHFDLVITDQTMPKMSGDELARKLSSLRDDLPIILMTGHGDLLQGDPGGMPGVTRFLAKPLKTAQLVENVLSLLKASADPEVE